MVKELGIRSASLPESICSGSGGSSMDTGEDEEFYERIEAPKFVDFTAPDHFRPDDHYWFCLRVGCEEKHEEEMDSERIYKDFVLRVMAARSPNVRLQKALNRNASRNMKCPMSVPSKYSKPRVVSRLAVASSISRKLGYEKEKVKPPTNPMSTPKAKTKQVAAKYLTTPRSKKCLPDANSFRSVQNPKPTTLAVPKNRMVAKALAFSSPKKAISLKKSVELRMPLTKLCEGMKRLEITSQKKRLLGHSNRSLKDAGHTPLKSMPLDSAVKVKTSKKDNRVAKVPSQSQPQAAEKVKPVKSVRGKKECNLKEKVENEPCSMEVEAESDKQIDANPSSEPLSMAPREKLNLSNEGSEQDTEENSENVENFKNHSTETQPSEVHYHENASTEGDDKENDVSADENRTVNDNNIKTKILGEQTNTIKKIIKPADKNLSVLKFKKPKPTNPKPFRLRTDERSILKESNFERKGQHPDPPSGNLIRKHGADTHGNGESIEQQNRGAGSNCKGKESSDTDSSLTKGSRTAERTKMSRDKVRSKTVTMTPKRPNASPFQERGERSATRKVKSPLEKKQAVFQRLASTKMTMASPSRNLAMTDKSSSSRGKRRVTVPKEPHFHTTSKKVH
ncbi:PREDICTED: AT-rich interactive domain-containing protein 4B [Ipomoea nil]|uniref:AT-rich interactive domain-containing protein 4B n=1 Tax=Ipomoea nil TaxID=35883 RepID=UPI000900CC54|nr:PREDICTED: AT-rich interactive domain-containing protein 4B [Ipomoea nil]